MKKVPFVSKEPHFTDEDVEIQSENGRNESSAQVHPMPESMLFSTTLQHSSVKVQEARPEAGHKQSKGRQSRRTKMSLTPLWKVFSAKDTTCMSFCSCNCRLQSIDLPELTS